MSQFLSDWLPIITVLIALAALFVAIWAQLRTQEAQRELQRPILILDEMETVLHYHQDHSFNWDMKSASVNPDRNIYLLNLVNVGAGLATRIEGVHFGPPDANFEAADRRLTLLGDHNLASGEKRRFKARRGRTLVYGGTRIGQRFGWRKKTFTLQAPPEPTPMQRTRLAAPRSSTRMTMASFTLLPCSTISGAISPLLTCVIDKSVCHK